MTQKRPELIELLFGFFPAQVIQVAARLAIADHLAGGPRSTAQLAASTGTDEAALYRLLRALVCIEVLGEVTPGRFELTERGELLRSDVAGSIRNLAMLFCGHESWRDWGELEHSVRTAEPAWEHLFVPPFEYLPAHPELNAIFNDGAGVSDRCRLVSGDFFDAAPEGADAYLLKSVIHDWDDDRSVAILRNCRAAMPPGGTVLIVEPIMPARPEPSPDVFFLVMSDLNMLLCTGGRERTEEEFRTVFSAAGLTLGWVTCCPGPTNFSVLEAVRDDAR